MASEVGKGAASGAATGMAAGPWGALIGAAVGAIGGFMKGRAMKEEAKRRKAAAGRMRAIATPGHLAEVVNTLNPLFRNIVESGLGPQFKGEIDNILGRHGLTGTGAGEAIRTSAQAVPSLIATERATEEGVGMVGRELSAEASAAGIESGAQAGNPLMEALLGGARGYLSGGGGTSSFKGKGEAASTGAMTYGGEDDPYSIYGGKVYADQD